MIKKNKILIVDDNPHFAEALRFLLESSFSDHLSEIHHAGDGVECLEIMRKNPVDIVFMDIEMPNMNGIEATKKISENYRNVKVIAVTFHSEEDYLVDIIEAGARGFVSKNKINKDKLQEYLSYN